MDMVQMYNPNLDNAEITVAQWGVPLFEDAGWVSGAAPGNTAGDGDELDAADAGADDAERPQPGPGTTSEAATAPDSDGATGATTDTGTASGSDTEEEGTPE